MLATVNSVAVNIGECVFFSVMVFSGHLPSSGIAESYGSFIALLMISYIVESSILKSPTIVAVVV